MMKTLIFSVILCCAITLPALAELTPADLDKIRLIVKEEVDPLKKDVAVIQGQLQGIDQRFDDVNKRIDHGNNLTYALIALIIFAIGIPAWQNRRDRDEKKQIEALTERIEAFEQQRSVGS